MAIVFERSRDPRLLEQYYHLREQCFKAELGLASFDGTEDNADRQGEILLARQGGRCLGGARISPQLPDASVLHGLEVAEHGSCIWERLALDPALRSVQLVRDFCANLVSASRQLGYRQAVVLSSLRHARYYRQCHSALGIEFRIQRAAPEFAQGAFAHLEHYLSVVDLGEGVPLAQAA